MASSFREYLQQQGVRQPSVGQQQQSPLGRRQITGASQQQTTQVQRIPFAERKGIIQTIFSAPLNLGKTLVELTPEARALQRSELRAKELALRIKVDKTLSPRTKQIAANVVSEMPTFENVIQPKSYKQVLGDVIGTGLFVVPFGNLIKGGKIGAHLARGAVTGGAFGGAEALSDDSDTKDIFKAIAVGAVIGGPFEAGAAGAGKLLRGSKNFATNRFTKLMDSRNPRFFMSIRTRMEKDFGEPGKEIIERFLAADRNHVLRAGKEMDRLNNAGLFNIDDNAALSLTDALEGRSKVAPGLQGVFDVVDDLRKKIGIEAQEKGFEVRLKRGVTRPFHPRKNYFPHITPTIERLSKGKVRDQVLQNSVRIGKFADVQEAGQALDSYLEFVAKNGKGGQFWVNWLVKDGQAKTKDQARGMTLRFFNKSRLDRSGPLEKARELDFPFYDPDPRRVIPRYMMGATKRLEEVPIFGQKFEEIDKLIGRIRRTEGVDKGQEIARLVKVARNAIETSPQREQVSVFLRTLQVPKLAFAQIANVGQRLNILLQGDLKSFAKASAYAWTEGGKRRALQTGATLQSVMRQSHAATGVGTELGEKFLKWTGFNAIERSNRIIAANAGFNYAQSTFLKLQRKPSSKVFISRLQEMGIDAKKALQRGTLTEDELLKAGQVMSEITQFRGRNIDLPAFTASPEGKLITQYKSFAFQQAKFLKDRFRNQVQAGNYKGVARDLIILSTVYPMAGEVIADIRSLVTGSKRPTNALDRYFSDFLAVGGFGIVSDTLVSANHGFLAENLLGPTASTITDGVQRVVQGATNKKIRPGDIKFLLNQTGFGRTISNYAFPNNRKEQDTFLKTLNELFSEFPETGKKIATLTFGAPTAQAAKDLEENGLDIDPLTAITVGGLVVAMTFLKRGKTAPSVLQIVNPKTGARTYKTVSVRNFEQIKKIVDSGEIGFSGENIGGKIYHLTAKSPKRMKELGFKKVGAASLREIKRIAKKAGR